MIAAKRPIMAGHKVRMLHPDYMGEIAIVESVEPLLDRAVVTREGHIGTLDVHFDWLEHGWISLPELTSPDRSIRDSREAITAINQAIMASHERIAELVSFRKEHEQALASTNPYRVGDLVHIHAGSERKFKVVKVNEKSVVVDTGTVFGNERVPLRRVRRAES